MHPTCTRSALRRVIDDADDARIGFSIGFEIECSVFTGDDRAGDADTAAPTPATTGPAYSTRSMLELETFALAAVDALELAGVAVQQLHPEFGAGQLEFALAPQDPLRAVDELVLRAITVDDSAHAVRRFIDAVVGSR